MFSRLGNNDQQILSGQVQDFKSVLDVRGHHADRVLHLFSLKSCQTNYLFVCPGVKMENRIFKRIRILSYFVFRSS
jgi:hypothetical protein